MRILIVSGIFPPDIGGPATYVPQVASYLSDAGHSVTVVTASNPIDKSATAIYPFKLIRLPAARQLIFKYLRHAWMVIRLAKSSDIIFCNGLNELCALASIIAGKPLVMKIVGDSAWERSIGRRLTTENLDQFQKVNTGLYILLLKMVRNFAVRHAVKIIVPSKYLAQLVCRWGVPNQKIEVIYNAIQLPAVIDPTDIPLLTTRNISTVARLVPWKGVLELLRALSQVEDIGLVVVGDGPERGKIQALISELHLSDRVYLAGTLSKQNTLAVIKTTRVFVLNSSYEGLPHVILEALALGKTVVATNVGGTPEVVRDGENGYLVPPGDIDLLTAAIVRAFALAESPQTNSAAALALSPEFSMTSMLTKTEGVLINSKQT